MQLKRVSSPNPLEDRLPLWIQHRLLAADSDRTGTSTSQRIAHFPQATIRSGRGEPGRTIWLPNRDQLFSKSYSAQVLFCTSPSLILHPKQDQLHPIGCSVWMSKAWDREQD
jgi:hypothetical protein